MISKLLGAVAVIAILIGLGALVIDRTKRAAIAEERRERMGDAIELIRESDKALGVFRKATDLDLCRALGGATVDRVCQ